MDEELVYRIVKLAQKLVRRTEGLLNIIAIELAVKPKKQNQQNHLGRLVMSHCDWQDIFYLIFTLMIF